MKYLVTNNMGAFASTIVHAENPDEALEIGQERIDTMLCHICSQHIELNDAGEMSVEDLDGNYLIDFRYSTRQQHKIEELESKIAKLKCELSYYASETAKKALED